MIRIHPALMHDYENAFNFKQPVKTTVDEE